MRDLESLRSHNDYYYFLMKLLKEEHKQNFMIAMESDKYCQDYIQEKFDAVELEAQQALR